MATAIVRVDLAEPPAPVAVGPRYQRAMVVFFWRALPIGELEVPVEGGVVAAAALERARASLRAQIDQETVAEWAGVEPLSRRPAPPATIAVCTRDRPEDLGRCLASLMTLPDDGQEILIVDSASATIATRDLVGRFPRARYLREERPGLDRARNRALREAGHDLVAFLDDDATAEPPWLRALTAEFRHARTLAVTGLTLPLELETEAQEVFQRTNGFGRGYRPVVHDGWATDPFFVARVGAGANMALRRSVLDLIGGFDEALDAGTATRSGGDHDLFTRILAAGYRIDYQPAALAWHRHRRDWPELEAAVRGYGTGVYGYLTARLLDGESRAVIAGARWLGAQAIHLARRCLGSNRGLPIGLAVAQLQGSLTGPARYLEARRLTIE